MRATDEVIAAVNQEVFRQRLNVIDGQETVVLLVSTNADPRQGSGLLFPEVFVAIKADLIDLETFGVILVIEFTKCQNAGRRILMSEDVEVEQHHLTFQVCQLTQLAFVVVQCNLNDASRRNL